MMNDEIRVYRGGSYLRIDGRFYLLSEAVDEVFKRLRSAGSTNAAFDAPPWFFSGSPYADAILALGLDPVAAPIQFQPEWLPQTTPGWASRKPIWPEFFGVTT